MATLATITKKDGITTVRLDEKVKPWEVRVCVDSAGNPEVRMLPEEDSAYWEREMWREH